MTIETVIPTLKKCPFCDFVNIHEDTITHHIKFTDNAAHEGVDVDKLDKSSYIIVEKPRIKKSPYGPYISTAELPFALTKCLWCNYKDKIEFDLSLHFLEDHKNELMAIPITRRERIAARALGATFHDAMEYRLDKAVKMAIERGE